MGISKARREALDIIAGMLDERHRLVQRAIMQNKQSIKAIVANQEQLKRQKVELARLTDRVRKGLFV